MKKKGVQYWTDRAVGHAIGILDSCDDEAFWGDDIENYEDGEHEARTKAKNIVFNRIDPTQKKWRSI